MHNLDELIDYARQIDDEQKRIEFVMHFFLQTVEYDYAQLVIIGYLMENLTSLIANDDGLPLLQIRPPVFQFADFPLKIGDNIESIKNGFSIHMGVEKGLSHMFDSIVELEKNSNGNINVFKEQLSMFFSQKFANLLTNEEIIHREINYLVDKIIKDLEKPRTVQRKNSEFIVGRLDTSAVLSSYLTDILLKTGCLQLQYDHDYFPPIIGEDGLLKRGVCKDYAKYLVSLLPKIGIEAIEITGTSQLTHAWVAAKINGAYKSIDLTRAIFARDGGKAIPNNQSSKDWLIADFADTFRMQPSRTITTIGVDESGNPIQTPHVIDKDNFDMAYLNTIIHERIKSSVETKSKNVFKL